MFESGAMERFSAYPTTPYCTTLKKDLKPLDSLLLILDVLSQGFEEVLARSLGRNDRFTAVAPSSKTKFFPFLQDFPCSGFRSTVSDLLIPLDLIRMLYFTLEC